GKRDPRGVGVRGGAGRAVRGAAHNAPRGSRVRRGRCALGALGIVTRPTLDLIPTFDRQTVVESLRSYDDVPEALAAAYSVSLFTYFAGAGFEQVWVKQRASEPELPAGWSGTKPARPSTLGKVVQHAAGAAGGAVAAPRRPRRAGPGGGPGGQVPQRVPGPQPAA